MGIIKNVIGFISLPTRAVKAFVVHVHDPLPLFSGITDWYWYTGVM